MRVFTRALAATGIVAATVFVLAAVGGAQENGIASVPISDRIPAQGRTTPGSIHDVSTVDVPDALVGGHCDLTVSGANNDSVHPNSDILVTSGSSGVVIPDVERAAGVETIPADGTLTLGETVNIAVRLGADGLFSGGALVVDFDCTPPPPPETTTTAPTATTTPPPVATTVPPKCVDNPATATNECTTLPHTGADTWIAWIGGILLVSGLVSLAIGRVLKWAGRDDV